MMGNNVPITGSLTTDNIINGHSSTGEPVQLKVVTNLDDKYILIDTTEFDGDEHNDTEMIVTKKQAIQLIKILQDAINMI